MLFAVRLQHHKNARRQRVIEVVQMNSVRLERSQSLSQRFLANPRFDIAQGRSAMTLDLVPGQEVHLNSAGLQQRHRHFDDNFASTRGAVIVDV